MWRMFCRWHHHSVIVITSQRNGGQSDVGQASSQNDCSAMQLRTTHHTFGSDSAHHRKYDQSKVQLKSDTFVNRIKANEASQHDNTQTVTEPEVTHSWTGNCDFCFCQILLVMASFAPKPLSHYLSNLFWLDCNINRAQFKVFFCCCSFSNVCLLRFPSFHCSFILALDCNQTEIWLWLQKTIRTLSCWIRSALVWPQ